MGRYNPNSQKIVCKLLNTPYQSFTLQEGDCIEITPTKLDDQIVFFWQEFFTLIHYHEQSREAVQVNEHVLPSAVLLPFINANIKNLPLCRKYQPVISIHDTIFA
ncbi:hypothetical protein OB236_09755 [Paenibacillus sp. WQ 127069]|uniref:Uncharacterized protein n=1 Tax=Paenibacillus baimaensis TaxID=2982185 RepID=A0ABT2UCP8_9BACL|nr:hypothetical protein [Paenibacillus sp. WQ 127069]MCU6792413.1 hypothetical protein [Paenibacillus sp. WQ 127069]